MIVLLLACLGLAVLAHVSCLVTTPWNLSLLTYILFNGRLSTNRHVTA
jgi:hypothetical protein